MAGKPQRSIPRVVKTPESKSVRSRRVADQWFRQYRQKLAQIRRLATSAYELTPDEMAKFVARLTREFDLTVSQLEAAQRTDSEGSIFDEDE